MNIYYMAFHLMLIFLYFHQIEKLFDYFVNLIFLNELILQILYCFLHYNYKSFMLYINYIVHYRRIRNRFIFTIIKTT